MGTLAEEATKLQTLYREVHELEEKLATAKAKKSKLQEEMAERMGREGVHNFRLDDGSSFYIQTKMYVNKRKEVDPDAMLEALREAKLGALIGKSYNANQLKAWVAEKNRELQEDKPGEEIADHLPESLKDKLNIYEQFVVTMRKG